MAFPITGSSATLTSVTASTHLNQLLLTALKLQDFTFAIETDEFDVSELDAGDASYQRIVGMRSGTASFTGLYPKSAVKTGNSGSVSGLVGSFIQDWKMDVDFGEQEITSFGATSKRFMPNGMYEWSGSFTAHAIDSTAVTLSEDLHASVRSAQFLTTSTGSQLAGDVYITQLNHAIRKADKQVLSYSYRGSSSITESGSPVLLYAGKWPAAQWDQTGGNGIPDIQIVFTTYTGRTYTSFAYLKSLSIEVAVNQPIKVSGQLRLNDAITSA
jgi:hypothetical protein